MVLNVIGVKGVLDPGSVALLVDELVEQITDMPDFHPDTIVALSTGGLIPAAMLAKRLRVPSEDVIGMPILKNEEGFYNPDEKLVVLTKDWTGRSVLVVDDTSDRGILINQVPKLFRHKGAIAYGAVLVANRNGIPVKFTGGLCNGPPPIGFWEE